MTNKTIAALVVLMVVVGIGTGLVLSSTLTKKETSQSNTLSGGSDSVATSSEKIVGSTNEKAFPDSATGTIESGGLGNEGTHKLLRDGGPSQTVYLVSSIVDLNEFTGKKVTIWGQTLKASKAPWLMDVGRIKINE